MKTPETAPKTSGIDRQDVILVLGFASFLTGIARWSVNAALITLGILCFLTVFLIQRAENRKEGSENDGSPRQ
jgi:membrane protein implicated in regulation of membrane protease activity